MASSNFPILPALVEKGTFREDLYYRINVINLHAPPLRERKQDILKLANYFVLELNKNLNLSIVGITSKAQKLLVDYDWPGNIRELKNVLESAMNFSLGSMLDMDAFQYLHNLHSISKKSCDSQMLKTRLEETEKEQLISVLEKCDGNRKKAASLLNLSKSTLYRLMVKHDLL